MEIRNKGLGSTFSPSLTLKLFLLFKLTSELFGLWEQKSNLQLEFFTKYEV